MEKNLKKYLKLTLIGPKKIILLFPETRVTRKFFTQVATNLFFNRFSGDIFLSSLVCFFFVLIFVVVCLLFLEIKNAYSDRTHSTMRASK